LCWQTSDRLKSGVDEASPSKVAQDTRIKVDFGFGLGWKSEVTESQAEDS